MIDRLSLRIRIALCFAALAVGGIAAIAGGLWLGHARVGGPAEGYVIAGLVAGFAFLGLVAWAGLLFDERVARRILAVASELKARARADVESEIDPQPARFIDPLAPAANAISTALVEARNEQRRTVARETVRINREKAQFEALLRDLADGVVVINPDNRVMLYNRAAQRLFDNLGLDRRIDSFVRPEPLRHAIDRMQNKRERQEWATESFLAATSDGKRFLLGRLSPIVLDTEPVGFVLIFHDATDDLRTIADRDHLFNTLMEKVRRPTAAIGAVLDVLQFDAEMPAETRATFDAAIQEEVNRLSADLGAMSARYGQVTARHWPMSEVAVEDIFDALLARRVAELRVDRVTEYLKCDGFAVLELLSRVIESLIAPRAQGDIELGAAAHDQEVVLSIDWSGKEVPEGEIETLMQQPLSSGYGEYSGRDVLDTHRTEIWSETAGDRHRIVLPLAAAGAPALAPEDARPEFYDFNLPEVTEISHMADRPLSELRYVVFDTETTGLSPREGDEIVQIAGVRILNGRILKGEMFDTLVNPKRRIPAASSAVHRITDNMVSGAPEIGEAGRRFYDFSRESVLVAHNAPFDLAFLRKSENRIGLRFDQPVLCTVLLSAALHGHENDHTLDALTDRFGVALPAETRHTALGDAMATAEVFIQMLKVLEGEGIVTLGDAISAGRRQSRIRRAQVY